MTAPLDRSHLKLLSYNIDGLNDYQVLYRTQVILGMILSEAPDVIHLQEVIPETYALLRPTLDANGYTCSGISQQFAHYFTVSAVKKARFSDVHFDLEDFRGDASSRQGRLLLKTSALVDNKWPSVFVNCHLESTGTAFKSLESKARLGQLQQGLRHLVAHGGRGPCLLSGDLNIRDQEAAYVLKGFPRSRGSEESQVIDVATALKTTKTYPPTWVMPGNPAVKCRFDRVYITAPSTTTDGGFQWTPASIATIGNDEILDDDAPYLTPSDHRGLVVRFALPDATDDAAATPSSSSGTRDVPKKPEASEQLSTASGRKRTLPATDDAGDVEIPVDANKKKRTAEAAEVIDLT